jgi:hypothetical protein
MVLALLLAACSQALAPSPENGVPESSAQLPTQGLDAGATETPEYRWSQLLARDSILPIYHPQFVAADEAGYSDDELVMGVAIGGEAKAYPISLLNGREMVNDQLGGTPILVTW